MAARKKIKKVMKIQSEEKTLLVFQRIIDSKLFQDEVKIIREKLEIPCGGFDFKKSNKIIKFSQRDEYSYTMKDFVFVIDSKYLQETKKIISLFPVMNNYYSLLIRNYIYYNVLLLKELEPFVDNTFNICRLMDAEEEEEYFLYPDQDNQFISIDRYNENVESIIMKHPVSIRIRSDVSQRTLIDFIKGNWKAINFLQKKYIKEGGPSFKNSKTRINQFIKKRDDFIYQHKNMPRRELWQLLNKQYKRTGLEYSSLGKIISRETKRRDIK